jgi:hypothetical protein
MYKEILHSIFIATALVAANVHHCFSQSLIVGIPSADVAGKNQLEFTHETQWNFWDKPTNWNSFNFACFGIGSDMELTATLNNLDNEASDNLALGFGGKKVFNVLKSKNEWEHKVIIGTNLLYSTTRKNFGFWSYGMYSFRLPNAKTRLTGGISYGTSHTYGFLPKFENNVFSQTPNDIATFLIGFEQPISKHVSLIADWYSGTHALAALIPAIQFDVGHHVLIFGYKIPNNDQSGSNALILEFMINIPTMKRAR